MDSVTDSGFWTVANFQKLAEEHVVPFAINLVLALLVFVIGRIGAKIITRVVVRVCERAKVDESLTKFIADLVYALLLMIVVIASLERLGIKTTAAIAVLGAAGLAVGLALQGSLGNFASGVLLIIFKPYQVGDLVTLAGTTGVVESIQIFNTMLLTGDNKTVILPNGSITGSTIVNITKKGQLRVDMVFGIGYDDDLKKAKELLMQILNEDERILEDPPPQVAVSELADSSVNFVVRPWVEAKDFWGVKFDTTEKVKLVFDENGISIPFPQQDVHMHQAA